jgi:hypothetical protein
VNEAIIEQGREFGLLARQIFQGGVEADASGGLGEAIRKTRELRKNPEVLPFLKTRFEDQDAIVRTDSVHQKRRQPTQCGEHPIVVFLRSFVHCAGRSGWDESKPAILLDFAVHLKLPCCSPPEHCPLSKNRRECWTLQRTIRRPGLKLGDLERRC